MGEKGEAGVRGEPGLKGPKGEPVRKLPHTKKLSNLKFSFRDQLGLQDLKEVKVQKVHME